MVLSKHGNICCSRRLLSFFEDCKGPRSIKIPVTEPLKPAVKVRLPRIGSGTCELSSFQSPEVFGTEDLLFLHMPGLIAAAVLHFSGIRQTFGKGNHLPLLPAYYFSHHTGGSQKVYPAKKTVGKVGNNGF